MEYISIIKDDIDLSQAHQYLRLPHPRTGSAQLYLPYTSSSGQDSILETVKLNGSHRRTWFVGEAGIDSASLLVHYPIDPLFLVIPLIVALIPNGASSRFQPIQDLISTVSSSPSLSLPPAFTSSSAPAKASESGSNEDIDRLLKLGSVKRVFKACCERKIIPATPSSPTLVNEASGSDMEMQNGKKDRYYRPSIERVVDLLKMKVEFFAREDELEKFDHLVRGFGRDGLLEKDVDETLLQMARIKAACEHLSQWLPSPVYFKLLQSYDFTPLNTRLANRTAAILASQPIVKDKKDATKGGGKKKVSAASRGAEALKKVNTNSMKKLTTFFKAKEKK